MEKHYPGRNLNSAWDRNTNTFNASNISLIHDENRKFKQGSKYSTSNLLELWQPISWDNKTNKNCTIDCKTFLEGNIFNFIYTEKQIERKITKIKIFPKKIARIDTLKSRLYEVDVPFTLDQKIESSVVKKESK